MSSRRPPVSDRSRDAARPDVLEDHAFALCLTHDVDRPYKTHQSLYYAVRDRDPWHLTSLLPGRNPYWTYEELMELEAELGVRSAFYFLDEQRLVGRPIREWVRPETWQLYAGRYSLREPRIVDLIRELDAGGWEVGLHGSYESYRDGERLAAEKRRLEAALGDEVLGGRQHYLNLSVPETWRLQREAGLKYDTSLGAADDYGFAHGYVPRRPFGDAFVEFPLTLMEVALPTDDGNGIERAWSVCEALLEEARANDAVMTVDWHPRSFSERDFPAYRRLYRRLVERALEIGAWVGPPGALYERLDHPSGGGSVSVPLEATGTPGPSPGEGDE
jgi:peptidoglycan/xylan/chitin deacetylase (PgdA/CDA1 family)